MKFLSYHLFTLLLFWDFKQTLRGHLTYFIIKPIILLNIELKQINLDERLIIYSIKVVVI